MNYPFENQLKMFEHINRPRSGRPCTAKQWVERYQKLNLIILEPYKSNGAKIKTKCLKCNNIELKSPANIGAGRDCTKCGRKRMEDSRRSCIAEMSKRLEKIGHTLLSTKYTNIMDKYHIKYKCGHINFVRMHDVVNQKKCCAICAESGFDPEKPAILYYLKFSDTQYKLGITNRTVAQRYRGRNDYEIIFEFPFLKGSIAYRLEQIYLKLNKRYLADKPVTNALKGKETFRRDIFSDEQIARIELMSKESYN